MNKKTFCYGEDTLDIGSVIAIADGSLQGTLSAAAVAKVRASQQHVSKIVERNITVYGVNTGFGILADTRISEEDTRILQHKILQSHSVGVGEPVPVLIARMMLITKMHALAQGFSGVRLETLERILWHIETDVIPVVPEKGSVGASGDLAPLAHLFLPLIGLGEVFYKGHRYPTQEMLEKFGVAPVQLGPIGVTVYVAVLAVLVELFKV